MTLTCNACGEQWDRHPALEVKCPKCNAGIGTGCKRPSGHAGPLIQPHVEREQLVVDLGVLELCPEGPTIRSIRGIKGLGGGVPGRPVTGLSPAREAPQSALF